MNLNVLRQRSPTRSRFWFKSAIMPFLLVNDFVDTKHFRVNRCDFEGKPYKSSFLNSVILRNNEPDCNCLLSKELREHSLNFRSLQLRQEKRPIRLFRGRRSGDSTSLPPMWPAGSIPRPGVKCGLRSLVLSSALRGFSPGTPVFPSPQKSTFDLICINLMISVSPLSAPALED